MRNAYIQQRDSIEITTKRRMTINNLDESSKRIVNNVFVALQKFALAIALFAITFVAVEAPELVLAEESADAEIVESTEANPFNDIFARLVAYQEKQGDDSKDAQLFAANIIARLRAARLTTETPSTPQASVSTEQDPRVIAIERFAASKGNLRGGQYAQDFVDVADEYGIEYEKLVAIGFLESTLFENECSNVSKGVNGFGWGGCKIRFESYKAAMDNVAANLTCHNPGTISYYCNGKTFKQQMYSYNSVNKSYYPNLIKTMNKIKSLEPATTLAQNS